MGGCIECALCVEACPFRAIVMAPDFEFGAYDREQSLVFNMHELRIAGTPEVDSAMEFIQGVKRGLAGQAAAGAGPAAGRAPAAAGAARAAGPAASARPAAAARTPAAAAAGNGAAKPAPAAAAAAPAAAAVGAGMSAAQKAAAAKGGPLGFTDDLSGLSSAERAKIYKERAAAAGIGRPAPKE
jgi:ferredoxin